MDNEITCFDCGEHICWATDSGPGPIYQCDECKENDENGVENV